MEIAVTNPRHVLATLALNAMLQFHDLKRENGAVQWVEDTDGRLIIFTRGEYKQALMKNVHDLGKPVEFFELLSTADDD